MTVLRWELQLKDRMSAPSSRMERALARVERQMAKADREASRMFSRSNANSGRSPFTSRRLNETVAGLNRQARAVRANTNASGSLASTLGRFAAGGAIVGALAGIASGIVSIGGAAAGSVVELAAFREQSLTTLEVLSAGDTRAAQRQFQNAISIANQTPADTQDVIRQTAGLRAGGFNEAELTPLLAGLADVSAARGSVAAESLQLVLSQMRSAGRVDGGDLRQLLNAGINIGSVLDNIANANNIGQGQTQERRRQLVRREISRGRVQGDVGVQAALGAISTTFDSGGPLGTLALRQSQGLVGALSNLRNAVPNLVLGVGFESLPGVVALRRAIVSVTDALAPTSARGQVLQRILGSIASVVAGGLARLPAVLDRVLPILRGFASGFGTAFLNAVRPLGQLFTQLTSGGPPSAQTLQAIAFAAQGLGRALGFIIGIGVRVAGTAALIVAGIAGLAAFISGAVTNLIPQVTTAVTGLGSAIVDGIVQGLVAGRGRVMAALRTMAADLPGPVRTVLGIRSPSRVFAEIGSQLPAGVEQGLQQGRPSLTDSLTSLVVPPAVRSVRPSGGGGATFHVTIHVNGSDDGRQVGEDAAEAFEDRIAAFFDRQAAMAGA